MFHAPTDAAPQFLKKLEINFPIYSGPSPLIKHQNVTFSALVFGQRFDEVLNFLK